MAEPGRLASLVENYVKPWQTVIALVGGVILIVTTVVTVGPSVYRHLASADPTVQKQLATAAGSPSSSTWGPTRRQFEEADRPDVTVLNSVGDNPKFGDERNFVQIKGPDGVWANDAELKPGKNYEMSIFVRNDSTEHQSKYTYVRVMIPGLVRASGEPANAVGFASSSSSIPSEVWDVASLRNLSEADLALRYITGTARLSVNGGPKEAIDHGEDLFGKDGVPISSGTNEGAPTLGPGETAAVTFELTADSPSFAYSSSVRVAGSERWLQDTEARRGDRIEIRLAYANYGSVSQDNVVLKNIIPRGLVYTPGSSELLNFTNPNGLTIGDGINGDGVNIGHYSTGANAFLYFEAAVDSDACGELTILSAAEATNGNKQSASLVKLNETC